MRYSTVASLLSTFLIVLGVLALPARAQVAASPANGVEMVVPFAPGSAADNIARVLAQAGGEISGRTDTCE